MRTGWERGRKVRVVLLAVLGAFLVAVGVFISVYASRFRTIETIRRVTDYKDYNLYCMDVNYDYDLDRLIE